jgi:two-component system, cell cycle sensor histidine kinase and response regulator CckA
MTGGSPLTLVARPSYQDGDGPISAVGESVPSDVQRQLDSLRGIASGVAHDLKNILQIIDSCTDLVSAAVGPNAWRLRLGELAGPDVVGADLKNIQLAVNRGVDLSNQLLALAGGEAAFPGRVEMGTVIGEVAGILRRTLVEGTELVTTVEPGIWPLSLLPGTLEQVLLNLAANARYAMKWGGTLTIEAENVPGCRRDQRRVRLQVSDTGVGMSAETMSHVLEPFFTTKPSGEGTGLGLASVGRIVTAARGTIEMASERGKGTTVTITLPTHRGPAVPLTIARV